MRSSAPISPRGSSRRRCSRTQTPPKRSGSCGSSICAGNKGDDMRVMALLTAIALCSCGDDDGGGGPVDGGDRDARIDGGSDGPTGDAPRSTVQLTTFLGEVQANLSFVAYQIADGPWQPLSGVGGVYAFELDD